MCLNTWSSDGGSVSRGDVTLRKWSLDKENGLPGDDVDTDRHSSP